MRTPPKTEKTITKKRRWYIAKGKKGRGKATVIKINKGRGKGKKERK